jgi:hypothetical protein
MATTITSDNTTARIATSAKCSTADHLTSPAKSGSPPKPHTLGLYAIEP